jgi:Ca-activated chloride channel homolog
MKKKILLLLLFLISLSGPVFSQQNPEKRENPTRILFVLDASRSMLGKWESDMKINIATKLLIDMVDSLGKIPTVQLALRMYGHQSNVEFFQDCKDSRLEVPFSAGNTNQIKQKLKKISCQGTTPIAYALEQAAKDFPSDDSFRNIIILITDGIEACEGDPCAVSAALQKSGVILKPFVIGIGLDLGFKETFDCVGRYYDASNEQQFKEVMSVVISQALNSTSAQVNLLDSYQLPTETDVNMTFYDIRSGRYKYNYVHTMNHRGVPDTILLDPLITYKMVVHTIPPIEVDSIVLVPGKHTTIAADAAQGQLSIKVGDVNLRNVQTDVYAQSSCNQLNIQTMNTVEKYLIGYYDLVIRTLPEIRLNGIEIAQSKTTTIEIPRAGLATFISKVSGFGSLYQEVNNELQWVCNLTNEKLKETLVLQPGSYRVVFRSKNAHQSTFTIDRGFKISSGSSAQINLY